MEIFLFKALQLILALSILVFVHELGHFMWSRIFKVGIEKFYLFFDTEAFALLRWNKSGLYLCNMKVSAKACPSPTEWGIGWIPFGGYCAIQGMVDETHSAADIEHMEGENLFAKRGKFAQFMIMIGGVLNNLILAVVIYIGMAWHWGKDTVEFANLPHGVEFSEYAREIGFRDGDMLLEIDGKKVDLATYRNGLLLGNEATVMRAGEPVSIALPDTLGRYFLRHETELLTFLRPRFAMVVAGLNNAQGDSPAAAAGLMAGDSIIGVIRGDSAFQSTPYMSDVTAQLNAHAGDTVRLCFMRGDSLMQAAVGVRADSTIGIIIRTTLDPSVYTHTDYTLLEAIPAGVERGWTSLYNYVRQFKLVFTREGAQSVGGFGSMGSIFPEAWDWYLFWSMTAFFSVALAFMNILPIPALDGGHILILIIEAIIRRPLSDKTKERAQTVGMLLIFSLLIFANANDIWKFIIKPFVGS